MNKKILFGIVAIFLAFLPIDAQYTKLTTLPLPPLTRGSLVVSNGFLYGTFGNNASYYPGVLYKIKDDGTRYYPLLTWNDWNSPIINSSVTLVGSTLYGSTSLGGYFNTPDIFRIDTSGSNYAEILNFWNSSLGYMYYQIGDIVYSNGILYGTRNPWNGMTSPCIYKVNADGSNATILHSLDGNSAYSPTIIGNTIYGMTNNGGTNGVGEVYKLNNNGSGYSDIYNFDGSNSGSYPNGSLILKDNFLYGMTTNGGDNGYGTIFKIDTSTNSYTKLHNFTGNDGANPMGSLLFSGDTLYGLTSNGGANNDGVIFRIFTDGSYYTDIFDFSDINGKNPQCTLAKNDNYLYGVTNDAVLFKYLAIFQSTNIKYDTTAQYNLSWKNGSGLKRLVFVKEKASCSVKPLNGISYSANSTFSEGSESSIGSGWYCVYNGTSNGVNISGLKPNRSYTVKVCEYYGAPASLNYDSSDTTGNAYTFNTLPIVQSSSIDTVQCKTRSTILKWQPGNGEKRIVFAKQSSSGTATPVNNNTYTANNNFGSGSQCGSGWFCVYNGTDTTFTLKGLDPNLNYTVKVCEFIGDTLNLNYYSADTLGNPFAFKTKNGVEQQITFDALQTATYGGVDIDPGAFSNFGLPITYSSSDTAVAKIVNSKIHIINAGNCIIYADQNGNDSINPAPQVQSQFTVNPATLTITASDTSRIYGNVNPVFKYTISGLIGADHISSVTLPTFGQYDHAGTYAITPSNPVFSVGSVSNYEITYNSGTFTINPSPLVITANNASRYYGDNGVPLTLRVSGLKGTDTIGGSIYLFASENWYPSTAVGTYAITFGGSYVSYIWGGTGTLSDYSGPTWVNGTLTINKAPLTITANAKSRLYGASNPTFDATITGFVNSQTLATSGVTGTASTICSATTATNVGTSIITATIGSLAATNYSFTNFVNGTLTISKAPLTITANNKSRLYGSGNPAFDATITGFVNGQTLATSGVTGTASTTCTATTATAVGTPTITCAIGTLSSSNYSFNCVNGTLSINKAPLTVTANNKSRLYGASNPAFDATITGFVNGQTFATSGATGTASTTCTATTTTVVGPATISCAVGTLSSSNYSFTCVNGTLTIGKVPLTVTANNKSRLYGVSNPTFDATITGFVNGQTLSTSGITGTANATCAATTATAVGSAIITCAIGTLAASNYSFTTFVNGTLTIGQAPLTITAKDTTRTYGIPNPVSILFTTIGLQNSDTINSVTYMTSPTCTTGSDTGHYNIIPSNAVFSSGSASNYSISYMSGKLKVTQATLNIYSNDTSCYYYMPIPGFTYYISGLYSKDSIDYVATSCSGNQTSPVGDYRISVHNPSFALGHSYNYKINLNNSGYLHINPAPITIKALDFSRTFGTNNPTTFPYHIYSVYPYTPTLSVTVSTVATIDSSIGNYAITPSNAVITNPSNYTFTYDTGTLFITKSPLTLTAINTNRYYGDVNPTFTGQVTGKYSKDSVQNVTFTCAATDTSDTGTYSIIPSGLNLVRGNSLNYTFTVNNGKLTVKPAPIRIIADNKSRNFGEVNPTLTYKISADSLKNSDSICSVNVSTSAKQTDYVGHYPIVPANPSFFKGKMSNYKITYTYGTLTINPATLTITAGSTSRVYGANNPVFSSKDTGLVSGDTIKILYNCNASSSSSIGTYAISPYIQSWKHGNAGNYNVFTNDGTLQVAQRQLTITVVDTNRVFGTSNPNFTAKPSGLRNGDALYSIKYTTPANQGSDTGTYTVKPSNVVLDPDTAIKNYTLVLDSGTLTIKQSPLTLKAKDLQRYYGDPNPTFTDTVIGLYSKDTIQNVTFTCTAADTSDTGTYNIVPSGLNLVVGHPYDYTFTVNNGKLKVKPAPITIYSDDKSREFGESNPTLTYNYKKSQLKLSDSISSVTVSTTAVDTSYVGFYPIAISNLIFIKGNASNYTIIDSIGHLQVTKASLALTVTNVSREYGSDNPDFSFIKDGLKFNDSINSVLFNNISGVSSSTDTGNYDIAIIPFSYTFYKGSADNYAINYYSGKLHILQAPLTVTIRDTFKYYGDDNPNFTVIGSVLQNSDALLSATYSTSATKYSDTGTYIIKPVSIAFSQGRGHAYNYNITYDSSGTLKINPAPLTITAKDTNKYYGDPNPVFTYIKPVLKGTDDITGVSLTSNVNTTTGVGKDSIIISNAIFNKDVSKDYAITYKNGWLTVKPDTLAITATDTAKVYGSANPVFRYTIKGLRNSDAVGSVQVSSSATDSSVVATYPIIPSNAAFTNGSSNNYILVYNPGQLLVTQANLTINANNTSINYGSNNPDFTSQINGLVNNDSIDYVLYNCNTYTTKDTGIYKYPITPYDFHFYRGLASNYNIIPNIGYLKVLPASLTITAKDTFKFYGDGNPNFKIMSTGLQNNDVLINPSFSTMASQYSDTGTYIIKPVSIEFSQGHAYNYNITYDSSGTLKINPAPLTITAKDTNKYYGDPNPVFTYIKPVLKGTDDITGISLTSTVDTTTGVGKDSIIISNANFNKDVAKDYAITYKNGWLTVKPDTLAITAADTAKVYGSANPVFNYTIKGLRNSDVVGSIQDSSSATDSSVVAAYPITPSNAAFTNGSANNYILVYNPGQLLVTQASLTITAIDTSKFYGDDNPVSFAYRDSGLKFSDKMGQVSYLTNAIKSSPIGSNYFIEPQGATLSVGSGNYSFNYVNGTFTIKQAPLTITAENKYKVYGTPNPVFTYNQSGLKGTDSIADVSLTSGADETTGVGTDSITASNVTFKTNVANNYAITYIKGILTVTPAQLTITAQSCTRTFGEQNPTFYWKVNGLMNNDSITSILLTTNAVPRSPIAEYDILASKAIFKTGTALNYNISYVKGILTVIESPIKICVVTADMQTGYNMVVWEPQKSIGIKSYNIYKQGKATGDYGKPLGYVNIDERGIFVDTTSKNLTHAEYYKITTVDSSGRESSLDQCNYHETMFLQWNSNNGGVNLGWNSYEIENSGMNFKSYVIYRGTDSSKLVVVDTVASNINQYTDTSFQSQKYRTFYRIAGVLYNSCNADGQKKAGGGVYIESVSNLEDNRLKTPPPDYIKNGSILPELNLLVFPVPVRNISKAQYILYKSLNVNAVLVNTLGQCIANFKLGFQPAGVNHFDINAEKLGLTNGIYYLQIKAGDIGAVSKIIVNR